MEVIVTERNMEAACEYISSRGFMGLCHVRPYIDRRTPHIYDKRGYIIKWLKERHHMSMPNVIGPELKVLIYVCSDELSWFIDTILSQIRTPFVLVSGDSDKMVPNEVINAAQVQKVIQYTPCIAWYAQNWIGEGDFVVPLPIGMDYHTYSGAQMPIEQERLLKSIRETAKGWHFREDNIFCNVQHRLDRWGDREMAIKTVTYSAPDYLIFFGKMGREETWREMIRHRYVLSPYGNGYDCHRVWESLLLGCVPIVRGGKEIKSLWAGLPVLCVDKWSDITPKVLADFACCFKEEVVLHERLYLKWWMMYMYFSKKID